MAAVANSVRLVTYWPEEWCVSFKHSCLATFPLNLFQTPRLPAGAKIVVFHGNPNPPEAVVGKSKPLVMRAWKFGEPLEAGVWNICEPKADAPVVEPDILIVPLLAFDRHGHRIGYGAGYYDLTIAKLREKKPVVAAGIALAAQEIAAVPTTPSDVRLDLVLTEGEVIDCRAA